MTSLDTITTEPSQKRNIMRAGIHLTTFTIFSTSTGVLAYETHHDKYLQDLPSTLFLGSIVGLIALGTAVEYIVRQYSGK